jgi:hypothetical protein
MARSNRSTRTTTLSAALAALALLAGQAAAETPIEDLYCNIQCDGSGPDADCHVGMVGGMSFTARRGDIEPLPSGDGVGLHQELALETPAGELLLQSADVIARFADSRCEAGFDILRGQSLLPVPTLGIFADAGVEIVRQPMAQVGLDLGRNLIAADSDFCLDPAECQCEGDYCLDATPVPHGDRHYLYFDFDAGYEFQMGAVNLRSPGAEGTFILDPLDPYFYITGELVAVKGVSAAGGAGLSWNSEIPFVPFSNFGMEDEIPTFDGTFVARLEGPIPDTPISVKGNGVYSLDPEHDGDNPLLTPAAYLLSPDLAYGINGRFNVSWYPWSKKGTRKKQPKGKKVQKAGKKSQKQGKGNQFIGLSFDIGEASAAVRTSNDFLSGQVYTSAWLSGELAADSNQLVPKFLPLPIAGDAGIKVAGRMSTRPEENFIRAQGGFGIDLTGMGKLLKLRELTSLRTLGELSVDVNGFLLRGTSTGQLVSSINPLEESVVEAFIAPNGVDSHLLLGGDVAIGGTALEDAALVLSPKGLAVQGVLQMAEHSFDMTGEVRPRGVKVTGKTDVAIHYEQQDAKRKLKLLDKIANQKRVVDVAHKTLAAAEAAASGPKKVADEAAKVLDDARKGLELVDGAIAAVERDIAGLESQLAAQKGRSCGVSYGGCTSCSSCSTSCGKYDVICKSKKAACQASRAACLPVRAACGLANQAACVADRDGKIVALVAQIGAKETQKATLVADRAVAKAALDAATAANEAARRALETVLATVEAARKGYAAARAGLALLQDKLDSLPAIEGDLVATVKLVLKDKGLSGKVKASFEGRKVADGWVDFEAQPPVACVVLPIPKATQSFCAPL